MTLTNLRFFTIIFFMIASIMACKTTGTVKKKIVSTNDGFELYTTGVLYNKNTALEWIVGPDIPTSYEEASQWAKNLSIDGGGWRLPTLYEIKTLYARNKGTRSMTPHLKTTGWHIWTSKIDAKYNYYFSFIAGREIYEPRSKKSDDMKRGFAVRLRLNKKYAMLEKEYATLLKKADVFEINSIGIEHAKIGDCLGAIFFYERAIEKDPYSHSAYLNRGKCYSMRGDFEKALNDFKKTIEIQPNLSSAYTYLGMTQSELGMKDKSVLSFNKAIEIDPNSGFAYYNRAIQFYRLGQYEKAWKDVKEAQSLNYQVKPNLIRAIKVHLES